MKPKKSPGIGDSVFYTDEVGVEHTAIVTANWGGIDNPDASINVVYVSDDESQRDQYGRQIVRQTSVVPKHNQPAHGRFYKASE